MCVCGCVCVGRGGGSLREGGREGGKEGGKEAKWTGAREGGKGKRIEEEGGKRCGECVCTSLVGMVQYMVSVCVCVTTGHGAVRGECVCTSLVGTVQYVVSVCVCH